MLRSIFEWLDYHPSAYWATAAFATLALTGWIAAGLRRARAPEARRWEWGHGLLLLLFLLAWRWPYLFAANEYNPDESQLIAGAITLWHDPVPWRSLDVATSGPLNYFALFPLHVLGLPFDYFTARLTALLLVWGALVFCHRLFRSVAAPAAASLAVLPAAVFFAAASDGDFVHYSSEHLPLFLTAGAAAGLFGAQAGAGPVRRIVAAGFVAGLLPWAKLQAGPLMAMLVAIRLGQLVMARTVPATRRWREAGYLLVGVALPAVLAVTVLAATGQLAVFWHSYLSANLDYVRDAPTLGSLLGQFLELSRDRGHLYVYGMGALFSLLLGAATYAGSRQAPGRLFILGLLGFGGAVACVLTPQRALLHYVLLTIVPLTWWTAAALLECWPKLRGPGRLVPGVFALAALLPLGWRWSQEDPDELGRLADDWRHPRSTIGNLLRAHSTPADALAIWGWWPALYVDAGLRQATHDGNTAWSMPLAPVAQRDYYQTRYLADLVDHRPLFFVDAVGPGAPFFTDRRRASHENVPALADYIRGQYRLWLDVGPARIYLRRDAAFPSLPSLLELAELEQKARRDPGLAASRPDSILPAGAPRWTVHGLLAQMMLPETRIAWQLDGTERAVSFDYGFHPKAWTEGRTNGAGFSVELQTGDSPPQLLFHRVMDPVRTPADRRPLATRLVLPPFGPGTKLIVRSDPGEHGDTSWDWVYLQRVRFFRSSRYGREQFPGFTRVPDAVRGEHVALINGKEGDYLSLHAPGALEFNLRGSERTLQFAYGFDPGAYTGEGRTDGAVFSVELSRTGGATKELFSRRLDPSGSPADRGRQQCRLTLADLQPGDRLVLRIEPGAGASWDWTYFAALDLH